MGDTCSKTCGKNVSKDDIDLDYFTNYAVCIMYPTDKRNVKAILKLSQKFNAKTQTILDLENLPIGNYVIHVHEFGNLQQGIQSAGKRFNPFLKQYDDPKSEEGHSSDLGNLEQKNDCQPIQIKLELEDIMLSGQDSVIGRSIIIKSNQDGQSIAEGVIAISQSFENI